MKRSLQTRTTLWFALSTLGVTLVFALVTYLHLRHELTVEKWERAHPDRPDFTLHGSYSKDEVNDIAGELLRLSLFYSAAVGLVAIGLGAYLSRQSLRPVASINRQLQSIGAPSLAARIEAPEADPELTAITANINGLLSRIETSYRDLSEFSARVAHELKTPLTLMRLQLEDAHQRIDPELAESLQDELQRMEHYVEQSLLIARAERGQLDLPLQTIALKALVEDLLEPFTLLAREENRRLQFHAPSNPTVTASAWAIRQILHNLIGNALKHGQRDIHIELQENQQAVTLTIQNDLSSTPNAGTGLGLKAAEAIAQQHPGLTLSVAQEQNRYQATLSWPRATGAEKSPHS